MKQLISLTQFACIGLIGLWPVWVMSYPFENGGQISIGFAQGFRNHSDLVKTRSWAEANAGSQVPVLSLEAIGFDYSGLGIGILAHGFSYLYWAGSMQEPIAGIATTTISPHLFQGQVRGYRETTLFLGPLMTLPSPEWLGLRVLPKVSIGYTGDLRREWVNQTFFSERHQRYVFRHCLGWTGELTGEWRVWEKIVTGFGVRFSDRQYPDFRRWDGSLSLGMML
jgi:hypothetical protein